MAITIKKSKRGSLHKHLGIPQGKKIPRSRLTIKPGDSLAIRKKKQFAINSRKWKKHELGGELPIYQVGGPVDYTGMGVGFMNTAHPENWNQKLGPIKQRLYNNLYPYGYNNKLSRLFNAVVLNKKDDNYISKGRADAWSFYMGKPQKYNTFSNSKYKPTNSKDPNAKYYSLNDEELKKGLLKLVDKKGDLIENISGVPSSYWKGNPNLKKRVLSDTFESTPGSSNVMGHFTIGKGEDEKGKYISYYDKWDISPVNFGKPFEIYDRIYLNENKDQKALGGELPIYQAGGFDPTSMAIQAGLGIGNAITEPLIASSQMSQQNIYSEAEEDLRTVDVKKMGRMGFGEGAGKMWWAGGVGAILGGLASRKKARTEAELFNEGIEERRFNKDVGTRFSTMSQSPTYMPVARQGGFTVYKGETHEGPDGGILTDEQGNPTGLSNNKPIALTEKNEVARFNPTTGSTYIYSDTLGFAKPATLLVNKYKLNKSNPPYKYDALLQTAVDRQFDNLTTAQEFSKETKTPTKDSLGMFRKGGNLTAAKAGEMLKNPPRGKTLTKKQKAYFGWVRGGRKEFGGELPMYQDGSRLPGLFNRRSFMEKYYRPISGPPIPDSPFLQFYFRGQEPTGRPSVSNYSNVIGPYGGVAPIGNVQYRQPGEPGGWGNEPIILQSGKVVDKSTTGAGVGTGAGMGVAGPQRTAEDVMYQRGLNATQYGKIAPYNLPGMPGLQKPTTALPTTAVGEDEQYSPWLSPVGHIASGVGALADYAALRKARPTDISLPRVGAERISLAKQRLINERNAAASRAISTASARGLGLSAGATMAGTTAATTGVNRLLGQQNLESLEREETINAQMRQQANMVNAELAAQEGLFNAQRRDAYNMLRARMNPMGALARTAGSYFIDNAAMRQQYDTLRMISPDAQMYQDPKSTWLKRFIGADRPQIRHADRSLYTEEEWRKRFNKSKIK